MIFKFNRTCVHLYDAFVQDEAGDVWRLWFTPAGVGPLMERLTREQLQGQYRSVRELLERH
jgi:hypothetical protein